MLDRFAEARLLIVDDDASAVTLLRTVLTRAGFKYVFTETDPRQAPSGLPEVDPDLIILALHMDHLDGFTVLEQIRRFAPGEYLPVLILTKDITAAAVCGRCVAVPRTSSRSRSTRPRCCCGCRTCWRGCSCPPRTPTPPRALQPTRVRWSEHDRARCLALHQSVEG